MILLGSEWEFHSWLANFVFSALDLVMVAFQFLLFVEVLHKF